MVGSWKPGRNTDVVVSSERARAINLTTSRLEVIASILLAIFVCGHLVLLFWFLERSWSATPSTIDLGVTFDLTKRSGRDLPGEPSAEPKVGRTEEVPEEEDEDVRAAIDFILASRGDEPKIRKPLADLKLPLEGFCSGNLPTVPSKGCPQEAVEKSLEHMFQDASGFWAADAQENAAVDSVAEAAGGPVGHCTEATYGELTVRGLRDVLIALRAASVDPTQPFDAFLDLGAGPGKTAAAAALLGFASQGLGVELGPQRHALGCQALSRAQRSNGNKSGRIRRGAEPWAAACEPSAADAGAAIRQPSLQLLRGDAQEWAALAADHDWPSCGPRMAIYLGAECFRDTLALGLGRAISQSCAAGANIAILGRRFPDEVATPPATSSVRWLEQVSSLHVEATWSPSAEVFLYRVAEAPLAV